jgi:hypothetical protein
MLFTFPIWFSTQLHHPKPLNTNSSKEPLYKDDDTPTPQLSKKQHLSVFSSNKVSIYFQLPSLFYELTCSTIITSSFLITNLSLKTFNIYCFTKLITYSYIYFFPIENQLTSSWSMLAFPTSQPDGHLHHLRC